MCHVIAEPESSMWSGHQRASNMTTEVSTQTQFHEVIAEFYRRLVFYNNLMLFHTLSRNGAWLKGWWQSHARVPIVMGNQVSWKSWI